MKKFLLTALILTFSTGMAVAQQQGGPNTAPGLNGLNGNSGFSYALSQTERLTERLGLSEEQAAELALIFEDAQILREQERARASQVGEEIRAMIREQIRSMLSPEQQALFDEHVQEREQLRQTLEELRAERGYGGFGGPGGHGTGDCINN